MTKPAAFAATYADWRLSIEQNSMPVPECGCWIWLKSLSRGYGVMWANGRLDKAHRVSWLAHRGPINNGFHVLHKCDVRACVNPDHLFIGTNHDNVADRERKGRGNYASGDRNGTRTKPWTRPRGEDHARAKLAAPDVETIKNSKLGHRELARHYRVSHTQIGKIKAGRSWKHV